jgi:type IV secretory pathway VirB10-like protein
MSETNKGHEPQDRSSDDTLRDVETSQSEPENEPGLRERIHKFIASAQAKKPPTKQELSKDRTRSLALLIGGLVGAILIFIGIFSTPPMPIARENRSHAGPNLGRPSSSEPTTSAAPRSVTPLLNADVRSDDSNEREVSPTDIQNTSQRSVQSENVNIGKTSNFQRAGQRAAADAPKGPASIVRSPIPDPDPLPGFSVIEHGAPTYRYGGPPTGPEVSSSFSYGGRELFPSNAQRQPLDQRKSSMVFVRSAESNVVSIPVHATGIETADTALLPPGTRLIARLEAAVTSALKIPVVASIEYNYERDGKILLPAGTKIIGELQQASNEGYVLIRFHTLQTPGMDESIEAVAVDFNQQPLKGIVSGKNTGKKLLSRTLSGVGTIAAYVVGVGGAGLNGSITGQTLLRDRVASNIALAGEQELMNGAYRQNITVTLPANTRFYVILEKPAVQAPKSGVGQAGPIRADFVEIPTAQELRELMELKREVNRLYLESNRASSQETKPE